MKSVHFVLTRIAFMLATDKAKTMVYLSPNTDSQLRIFAARHRKGLSEVVEAALLHCLDNRHFIEKLTPKKEEIDY